jgi:RNA polymerase sigma-70 factor (ECF subfamily)
MPASAIAALSLVERLTARDPRAVDEFYRQYRPRILAVALRVVGNPWDAEEVLQDVVWTVVRKADTFRGEAEFSSWLYRVTQNCAKMLLRKRKRVPLPLSPEQLEPAVARAGLATPDLHDQTEHRQLAVQLHEQVGRLDTMNQQIFWLAEVEGEAAAEIGARLGLTVSAIKARLFRIRATLRLGMGGLVQFPAVDGPFVAPAQLQAA